MAMLFVFNVATTEASFARALALFDPVLLGEGAAV